MSVRYLEIDSTYRDRVSYPAPASFIVQMAQSGQAKLSTPFVMPL